VWEFESLHPQFAACQAVLKLDLSVPLALLRLRLTQR